MKYFSFDGSINAVVVACRALGLGWMSEPIALSIEEPEIRLHVQGLAAHEGAAVLYRTEQVIVTSTYGTALVCVEDEEYHIMVALRKNVSADVLERFLEIE